MSKLTDMITKAAQKYYTDGTSDLTDEQFDKLVSQVSPDELPEVGWGYDVSKDTTPGNKVNHKYGLVGSLQKCHNWSELRPIFKSSSIDVSLKLDGLSMVLYYHLGQLELAVTRGDGRIGIDVTDKIRVVAPWAVSMQDCFTGAIRGEVLMPNSAFEEFKIKNSDSKNPRNSTAGLINSKGLPEDLKYLELVVYTVIGCESRQEFKTCHDIRNYLTSQFGEHVVPYTPDLAISESTFDEFMERLRSAWYNKYPADGIVITCEQLNLANYPSIEYEATAYKFKSEVVESEVEAVEWDMSKTRYAIPRIRIQPVQLAGTTVQYASGYHAQYIRDNNIGPGTRVLITKSGEIIPNIIKVISGTESQLISNCPDCGCKLEWSGVHLVCRNPKCSNAVIQDTLAWINNLVPTDGLGNKLIISNLRSLVLDSSVSIDDESIDSIMKYTGKLNENTGSIQFNKFSNMMNRLLHDARFELKSALMALNIPRLGDITCEKLAAKPDLVDMIRISTNGLDAETDYELLCYVGTANRNTIVANLDKFRRLTYIWDRIDFPDYNNNKTLVCVTGKLSVPRNKFEIELNSHGFVLSEMKNGVQYLITDDPNSNSSKNKKAEKLGIPKITESEFRSKFF